MSLFPFVYFGIGGSFVISKQAWSLWIGRKPTRGQLLVCLSIGEGILHFLFGTLWEAFMAQGNGIHTFLWNLCLQRSLSMGGRKLRYCLVYYNHGYLFYVFFL
ncbi:hypothetical protein QBC44DRAFT_56079 [Cladorrhinum sp. PSN332]|nr:hypothetical protein QBC44DRAFT_56079 [Cladorrhinum sp. PSN332]